MTNAALKSRSSASLLSVIVPVFNEEKRIIENLDLLIDEIESTIDDFEIIVVSDGSTDQTNFKVFSFKHPKLRLNIVEQNKGKGYAVRSGFKQAKGDAILFIDGGMELHPREIRIFIGLLKLYDADIVIGSKRHPQSVVHYPWYRKLFSWIFQQLIRGLFQVNVTDTQVGIKLFRRQVIDDILPYLEIDRYGFDLEMITLAKIMGHEKVLEAPIRMDYFSGQSRTILGDIFHVLRVGLSLLKDTWKLHRRMRDVRIQHEQRSQV